MLPESKIGIPLQLLEVLLFGCAYERIADGSCSESTLRRRREEWIELGVMDRLRKICLEAYDRLIGLELSEVAVDGCITKAWKAEGRRPDEARWTVANGASSALWPSTPTAFHANGIPLGTTTAPANRHDSPLLIPTLKAVTETLGSSLPEEASVHLDRGYDSLVSRQRLRELGLGAARSLGRASRRLIGPGIGGW